MNKTICSNHSILMAAFWLNVCGRNGIQTTLLEGG